MFVWNEVSAGQREGGGAHGDDEGVGDHCEGVSVAWEEGRENGPETAA